MKKFITLLLLICTLLLAFNLLFKAAPVYAEEEPRPSLIDDIIPKNKEKLKYEEYPPSSYGIDVYTPEGGFGESLKFWKWKDNIKEQIVATIFILISIGWSVNLAISSFVTSMVGQSMSLNIVADVGDKLGDVISKAAGFNGSWGNGIYSELIGLMLALLACWVIWVGFVQRRQSEMLGGLLKALGILVFTLAFFANSSYIIKGLNTFSEQVNKTVLDSTQSISGASEGYSSGVDSITDLTHTLLIKQPYTLLQFGTTDMKKIGDERIKKMLSTTDPEERKALLKDEVEVQKNQTLSLDATFERGALVLLLGAINLPLWIVLGLCSMAMLFYQLMFIIVALMSPVMLLMALVPAWTGTAKKFLSELFRTLLMKVAIGFLVTLMFWVSSILFSATDKYGYLVVAALQVLSFLGVWLYRKTIFDAITTVPASAGAARASDAMSNIRQKYRDVKHGSKSIGKGVAVAGASAVTAGKIGKSGYSKFKQLKENYADRKEKVADGKRKEKEQMQAEKEKNINQMKKDENLGVRDRKGNQEQERVKEEVAATKENPELAVRGNHEGNDPEMQQAELKGKEEDVKADVKPVAQSNEELNNKEDVKAQVRPVASQNNGGLENKQEDVKAEAKPAATIKTPTGQTKPVTTPQLGTPSSPANPMESKPITTPQSGTPSSSVNPMESKPITPPQSVTPPSPANPMESKPITTPQSGTPSSPANPMESKPITPPQSVTPPSPANPMESKPITPPQSVTPSTPANPVESKPITPPQAGTTPSQPNPIESKPVTTSQVSTPQKQVEVKPVNSQPTKNVPKVNNQQQVKEGAAIKKVETKAQTQQEALKNVKAKETIKPK
ncbi:hypothetical protein COF42_24760 [Bacillus wiedmannii]|uniref:CD3337/EF1877 family mobilome membrane protein n=1 Tax=Bacillus wiedmannii TaxID=1890302 RepID=UPI000BFE6834|nr:hypothetical protein [Bacillus wiedmannii]PHC83311.1 hypothetical protein COF42_24760 [Bacillus wiedmannii]